MVEDESSKFYKQKFDLNITIASQMRLNHLLDKIAELDSGYPIDSPEKQKSYLSLVRQYFITAVPYLSIADSKEYMNEILSFRIIRKSDVSKGTQGYRYSFNPKLDVRLNQILVELQIKLRRVFNKVSNQEEEDGL